MSVDPVETMAADLDLLVQHLREQFGPVQHLREQFGPPWHDDAGKALAWRWSPDPTDRATAETVLDAINHRGALVEVWVWSDAYQGQSTYARIEGVRGAAHPLFFHQFEHGVHIFQRCLGPLL